MSESKVDKLFSLLREACQASFGFVPNRISSNMQYMGKVGHATYRFRDSICHAEIHMRTQPLKVELKERDADERDWTDGLLASYRRSDDDVIKESESLERRKRKALKTALWASQKAFVLSLYQDEPTYKPGRAAPYYALKDHVHQLAKQDDQALREFSEQMGIHNLDEVAGLLGDAYHFQKIAEMWKAVRRHELFDELIMLSSKANESGAVSDFEKAEAFAGKIVVSLPRHLQIYGFRMHCMVLAYESQKYEIVEPVKMIHYRVTLYNQWNPNMTISVWAEDKESAKDIAAELHKGWDVVQARISNDQTRREEA